MGLFKIKLQVQVVQDISSKKPVFNQKEYNRAAKLDKNNTVSIGSY
jgi:hypothetical protein